MRELNRRPNVTLSGDADAGRRPLVEPRLHGNVQPERGACSLDKHIVGELPDGDNARDATSRFRASKDPEYHSRDAFNAKYDLDALLIL